MPSRATVHDLAGAGFTVRLASGSVSAEQAALDDAKLQAAPAAVQNDAETVARDTARAAVAQGLKDEQLAALVARATASALDQIQVTRDTKVAFHQRALEIAEASPDVWYVTHPGDPDTSDDDVRLYIACKPDGTGWDKPAQNTLDQLRGA